MRTILTIGAAALSLAAALPAAAQNTATTGTTPPADTTGTSTDATTATPPAGATAPAPATQGPTSAVPPTSAAPSTSGTTDATAGAAGATAGATATTTLAAGLPVKDNTGATIGEVSSVSADASGGQLAVIKMGEQTFSVASTSLAVRDGAAHINATQAELSAQIAKAKAPTGE